MHLPSSPKVVEYTAGLPVKATSDFDLSSLSGKSVLITGAGRGLGKAYAEAFVKAGAFVTVGDIDEGAVKNLVTQLGEEHAAGVCCDVRQWKDQLQLFETAISLSPSKSLDIVIANAGLGGAGDAMMEEEGELFSFVEEWTSIDQIADPDQIPQEPALTTIDVNLKGLLYTTKLATHYFRRFQKRDGASDRCLILKSSVAGFVDWPKALQYPASKAGVRVLMKCLRRTVWKHGIRVNVVAPAFVDTNTIPQPFKLKLMASGMQFAEVADAVTAILKISCDTSIVGRSLAVIPRAFAPEGYLDFASDDLKPGDPLYAFEQMALNIKV